MRKESQNKKHYYIVSPGTKVIEVRFTLTKKERSEKPKQKKTEKKRNLFLRFARMEHSGRDVFALQVLEKSVAIFLLVAKHNCRRRAALQILKHSLQSSAERKHQPRNRTQKQEKTLVKPK